MQNRFNKPRVFLSHAWENKPFIRRIADDLRSCQIDFWLDEYEIRDGRPWLKMIFEDGIPTCDAVLVYFTNESLNSKLVERELDAAVVHQLSEGGVRLLPYVSEDGIRAKLRSDLQTLHCREWNDNNYHLVLPTVVAEIWRSYHERKIDAAVLQEKNRRLEQELENKRLQEQLESSVFLAREEQEFQYLHQKLSRKVEITFHLYTDYDDRSLRRKVGTELCRVSILRMLLAVIDNGQIHFDTYTLEIYLLRSMGKTLLVDDYEVTRVHSASTIESEVATRFLNEFQTYGLTKIKPTSNRSRFQYEIAEKMYRFRYWLEYKGLLVDEHLEHVVTLSLEDPQIAEQQTDEGRLTAEVLAADKKISQVRRRKAWSTNGEGTLVVIREFQTIFDNLNERVSKSNAILENIKLEFRSGSNGCTMTTGDVTMTLEGKCPSQNTEDCLMIASATARKRDLQPGSDLFSAPQQVFLRRFIVSVDNNLQLRWKTGDADDLSAPKLAEYCWSTLLQLIQQHEEKG